MPFIALVSISLYVLYGVIFYGKEEETEKADENLVKYFNALEKWDRNELL